MQTVFLMPIEIALQPKFNAKLPHPTLCMLQLKFFVVPYVTAAIYRIPVYFGNELFIQKCSKIPFAKNILENDPHGHITVWHSNTFVKIIFVKHKIRKKNLNKLLYGNWDA